MDKVIITNWFHDGKSIHQETMFIHISNGKIVEKGKVRSLEDVRMHFSNARIEDLRNYLVTPGIIDSHNHFTLTALKMKYEINLGNCYNFNMIFKTIDSKQHKLNREWIIGYNLNEFNLMEKRLPTTRDLDNIVFDKPLFITHSSEHYAVCNSLALKISGINKNTLDPAGSIIGRFNNGDPNGILYESPAMNLVKRNIPEYSIEEYEEALNYASGLYRKHGITTVKDIGGTGNDINEKKRVEAINNLSSNGRLSIRVGIALPIYSTNMIERSIDLSHEIKENDMIKFVGFKLFLDGSGLSRTAWMKNEWNIDYYKIDHGNKGRGLWNIDEFREAINKLATLNTTISIHAIGDRAISTAIQVIREAKMRGKTNSDFTIIHCNAPDLNDIREIKDLSISIESQASFMYFIGSAYLGNFGVKRGKRMFPFRTMIENGINLCNGSDSPVTDFDPIFGIVSSISRKMKYPPDFDAEFTQDEKLDLEQTIRTYTANGALSLKWKEIGNLKEGNNADMLVWKKIPEDFDNNLNSVELLKNVIFSGSFII